MRKTVTGLTLVELVVVVAIVVFLATVALSVGSRTVFRAKQTSTQSKLKQLHLATTMYRSDWDGDGRYGALDMMGLPPADVVLRQHFDLPIETLKSSCGTHPSMPDSVIDIVYAPGMGGDRFEADAILFRENHVLFYDMNCSDSDVALLNEYETKLGLGVLLSGQAIRARKTGRFWQADWWAEPE